MKETNANKYYLTEFSYNDDEYKITLYIVDISFIYETITAAITRDGKITQETFPLFRDNDGKLYFEYGRFFENKIAINDFA